MSKSIWEAKVYLGGHLNALQLMAMPTIVYNCGTFIFIHHKCEDFSAIEFFIYIYRLHLSQTQRK